MSLKDQLFTDTPAENYYEYQDLLGLDPGYDNFLDAMNGNRKPSSRGTTPAKDITRGSENG